MPGEGLEPSRPQGAPDFKSDAYDQFRHPGREANSSGGRLAARLERFLGEALRALVAGLLLDRVGRLLVELRAGQVLLPGRRGDLAAERRPRRQQADADEQPAGREKGVPGAQVGPDRDVGVEGDFDGVTLSTRRA